MPFRFFLSCYVGYRHLHSFPTRRSSDLASLICTGKRYADSGPPTSSLEFSAVPSTRASTSSSESSRSSPRSEEHTSELQSQSNLVCRLLLEKKKKKKNTTTAITKTRQTL